MVRNVLCGLAWSLCVASFGAGCQRTPQRPETDRAPSEPRVAPTAPVAHYRVEPVAHGGVIRGRVVFDGAPPAMPALPVPESATPRICGATQTPPALVVSPTGGVRDAVLSIAGLDHGKAMAAQSPRIDQHACQYTPHIGAGMLGQNLEFSSSDPTILHTVRGYRGDQGSEGWFARATPAGVTVRVPLDREGLGTVYCDSGHTWMLGYVWTFANPYFATSADDGSFEITEIPAGTYALHAWHEGFVPQPPGPGERARFSGAMERDLSVTVPADGVVNVRVVLSAGGMRAEIGATDGG